MIIFVFVSNVWNVKINVVERIAFEWTPMWLRVVSAWVVPPVPCVYFNGRNNLVGKCAPNIDGIVQTKCFEQINGIVNAVTVCNWDFKNSSLKGQQVINRPPTAVNECIENDIIGRDQRLFSFWYTSYSGYWLQSMHLFGSEHTFSMNIHIKLNISQLILIRIEFIKWNRKAKCYGMSWENCWYLRRHEVEPLHGAVSFLSQ